MLAACRCLGLPARYVSGYLHSPHNGGADLASHAWVDIYLAGQGWLSLDPTHHGPQTADYVRVAVGRGEAGKIEAHQTGWARRSEALQIRCIAAAGRAKCRLRRSDRRQQVAGTTFCVSHARER